MCKLCVSSRCHHNSSPFASISAGQAEAIVTIMILNKSISTEFSTQLATFHRSRPNEQLEAKESLKPGEIPKEDPVDDNQMPVRV